MLQFKVLINTVLNTLSFLPLTLLHRLAVAFAYFLYFTPNRLKSTTLTNLNLCFPEKSNKDILRLARLSLIETSKTFFESGKNWIYYPRAGVSSVIEEQGFSELKDSLALNKGVILFAPHMGNIEVIINYLANQVGCTIPYTEAKIPAVDKIIKNARSSVGALMVKSSTSGVRSLLKALTKGEVICIACDQVPAKEKGIIANFFGIPALTMSLVVKLANKTNSPCLSVSCVRKKRGEGFKIYFSKKLIGINSSDLQAGVHLMNQELEKCIMRAPEQYAWEYKRFKRSLLKSPYK